MTEASDETGLFDQIKLDDTDEAPVLPPVGPQPGPEAQPEPEPQSATETPKRRILPIIGIAAIVLLVAGLVAALVVTHNDANHQHRRANKLNAELNTTEANLSNTRHEADSLQSLLSQQQKFTADATAVGAKLDQCVGDINTFLNRATDSLNTLTYDPTLEPEADRIDTECGDAQNAFAALQSTY